MRIKLPTLILCVMLSCNPTEASQEIEPLFLRIKGVAESLKQICPPRDCTVIGIGGSPTSFIAYLQSESPDYAFNLPLHVRDPSRKDKTLAGDQRRRLFQHFDDIFPSEQVIRGRKILLFDYSISGETATTSYQYVCQYLIERINRSGSSTKSVEQFGIRLEFATFTPDFVVKNNLPNIIGYAISGVYHLNSGSEEESSKESSQESRQESRNDPLLDALFRRTLQDRVQYEPFYLFTSVADQASSKAQKRPMYIQFLKIIQELKIKYASTRPYNYKVSYFPENEKNCWSETAKLKK